MPDGSDPKERDPSRILFGIKDPPKPPKEIYRQGVHLRPGGTATPLEPTKEGRRYLDEVGRRADAQKRSAKLSAVPTVEPRARSQERIITRETKRSHDKMSEKDKGEDLEL